MKKKVFITGGSGLLALNWAILQRDLLEVTLCLHKRVIKLSGVKSTVCALDSVNQITNCLKQHKPDAVIHTAGLTSVEKCEENPELAEYVNVVIARNVSAACAGEGVQLVHISTDHLFDGTQSLLTEDTPVSPINVYGLTKAKAEEAVFAENQNALIIRTNFYCWGTDYRQSFSDFVIGSLRNKQPIYMFDDVFYTPIIASKLIRATHELIDKGALGVFNVVGDIRLSKYEFGNKLAELYDLETSVIKRCQINDNHDLVVRPKDMSLTNRKLSTYLGRAIGGVDEHFKLLYQQEKNGISTELIQL